MKGLFIPGITAKMFKDASLESVAELMTEGEIYDIDYQEPCKEQEPKQGHWIVVDDCGDNLICECSECKDEVWFKEASRMWNYCSSCGARMKGVEE